MNKVLVLVYRLLCSDYGRDSHIVPHIYIFFKSKDVTSGKEGADHETEADSSHSKYKEEDKD